MELVVITRVLWRCRIAVAIAAIVAIGLGLRMATGPSTRAGVASVPVMLDTQQSQTVTAAPKGLDTLQWRAGLLADLVAAEPIRGRIAQELGISRRDLIIESPSLALPEVSAPLPDHALLAAAAVAAPYRLSLQVNAQVPILSVDA